MQKRTDLIRAFFCCGGIKFLFNGMLGATYIPNFLIGIFLDDLGNGAYAIIEVN